MSRGVAEALADFQSIRGDFIYRHHNEPRVQLYVPKEETFPIPLKYIDVTRSTHANVDVMQEKRIDDYWNADLNDKFFFIERKPPRDICGPRETDKSSNDNQTWSCVAWGVVQDWKSHSESRRTRVDNWKTKNFTMLDNWWEFISLIQMMKNIKRQWKMQGKSWKHPWHQLCLVKEGQTWIVAVSENGKEDYWHLKKFQKRDLVV